MHWVVQLRTFCCQNKYPSFAYFFICEKHLSFFAVFICCFVLGTVKCYWVAIKKKLCKQTVDCFGFDVST